MWRGGVRGWRDEGFDAFGAVGASAVGLFHGGLLPGISQSSENLSPCILLLL